MFKSESNGSIEFWYDEELRNAGLVHGFFGRNPNFRNRAQATTEVTKLFSASSLALLKQTHSIVTHSEGAASLTPEGDGWILDAEESASAQKLFGVLTADCIPVVVYLAPRSSGGRGKAAVLHCGWRGTVGGLLEAALLKIREESSSQLSEATVLIGPGASKCCFEIQTDTVELFNRACERIGLEKKRVVEHRDQKLYADIKLLLSEQAAYQGIGTEKIRTSPLCSICDPRLSSHRREKEQAGRQVTVVGSYLRPGAKFGPERR
jgi:copper oxidase (laccase) domain-containing protein